MEKFTENQRDVLIELHAAHTTRSFPMAWCAPINIGGTNGSHHFASLKSMQRRGYVQTKYRGNQDPPPGQHGKNIFNSRGSKLYRLTPRGTAMVEAWHNERVR